LVPDLVFFCELDTPVLRQIVDDGSTLPLLSKLNATICLAVQDMSRERAEIVKDLNMAGIPVSAWINQDRSIDYRSMIEAAEATNRKFEAFKFWTIQQGLTWRAVGLDLPPDRRVVDKANRNPWFRFTAGVRNMAAFSKYNKASRYYKSLANQIRAEGFLLEAYHVPILLDERILKTNLAKRFYGLFDFRADREIVLLYNECVQSNLTGYIWSYGKDSRYIGFGGLPTDETSIRSSNHLEWNILAQELQLAFQWANAIYIFSLEDCLQRSILPNLVGFGWDKMTFDPSQQGRLLDHRRSSIQLGLWLASMIPYFMGLGVVFILLYSLYFNQKKR